VIDVVRAELFAARRRPGIWVIGAVWLALAVVFGLLVPVIVYHAIAGSPSWSASDRADLIDSVLPAHVVSGAVGLYPLFGSAMMLLLGVIVMGGEYRWGTIGTLLTQGPGRSTALLGKCAALAAVLLGVTVVVFAVFGVVSLIVAGAENQPIHWPGIGTVLAGIGAAWLVGLAAAAVGTFLAILFRGTGTAIGVGLVWLLGLENAVSQIAGLLSGFRWLQRLLIGPSAGSLASALGASTQSHGGTPGVVASSPPWLAVTVLLAYVLLFTALSALLLRRRDVTA
jgi:ABC-2 type transport system permease protein